MLTAEETNQLVEFLVEAMKHHIHKVNENKNKFRFLPYLTGFAMNQYIKSGSGTYEKMQADNVIVMPYDGNQAEKEQIQKVTVL